MDFVKRIIDEWDPIDLLSHAPDDEYHSEIAEIGELLNLSKDFSELAEGIYQVFSNSFGKDVFCKSRSECAMIAQKIISAQEQSLQ